MNTEELMSRWERFLEPILSAPGGILYSAFDTLKRRRFYLLGLNPGGAGGMPIRTSITMLPELTDNAYLCECWASGGRTYAAGEAPLQRRVQYLCDEHLRVPTDSVCASNLIFVQSPSDAHLSKRSEGTGRSRFLDLARICWPVHEDIVGSVDPDFLVVFGNGLLSPFTYLKSIVPGYASERNQPSGHGGYRLKSYDAQIGGRQRTVIGLPHLSRYDPCGKDAFDAFMGERAIGR